MNPVLVGVWRDSEANMRRALASCARHVSGISISCDPGYPADAITVQQLAREFGLPAHVYFTPRPSIADVPAFIAAGGGGGLRTEMMREGEAFAAAIGAEYLVNLDSDDELAFDRGFRWPTGDAVYLLDEHMDGLSWTFKRVFRVGLGWKWFRPLHEEPYCDASPIHAGARVVTGCRYVKHADPERPPEHYLRHAEVFRAWVKEHPEDYAAAFYIARSLHVAGRLRDAADAYETFLAGEGSKRLKYQAAAGVAAIAGQVGAIPLQMLMLLARVVEIDPERAEPWRALERFAVAVADRMPVPTDGNMVEASAYGTRAGGRAQRP